LAEEHSESRRGKRLTTSFQFDAKLHEYVVENQLQPHVTGILECYGLIDYSMVPPQILGRKMIIGDIVHKITHYIDEDGASFGMALGVVTDERQQDMAENAILDVDLIPYIEGWERFLAESGFECLPDHCEKRYVATVNGMRYGMTIDRAGILNKRHTILDLKCTHNREKSWPVQLAGYGLGLPRPSNVVRWERAVVWLKPDGGYQLCPGGRNSTDLIIERRDEEVFLAALRLTHWKIENFGHE
jgi:hypothetical protein